MNKVTKVFHCVLLLCLLCYPVYGSNIGYHPEANPEHQLEGALKQAQKQHKLVLMIAGGDWCSWCHYLNKFLNDNPDIYAQLKSTFAVVKIYVGEKNDNKAFFSRFPKALGYPHFWVISSDGKVLKSQNTAPLENGKKGYNRKNFLAFIQYWKQQSKKK